MASQVPLGERFRDALAYTAAIHADQRRKGTGIPYIAHLLGVCSLVLEGASEDGALHEDLAIAALLHDAAEDQGGQSRLDDIRARFGARVAEIVEACSDSIDEDPDDKEPWRERKERYLAHLDEADEDALRVSVADKLHNARTVLADYRRLGDRLWERFHREADVLWYYRSVAGALSRRLPGPQSEDLTRVVDELERLAGPSAGLRGAGGPGSESPR